MYDSSMMRTAEDRLGLAGSTGFIATIGGLVVLAGAALAAVRFVGGTPTEQGLEGAMGALALGTIVAVPGVLALLGLADRPALLIPAATVLVPLSFLSLAGVTLPLLIPAVMLFIAYGRRSSAQPAPPGRAVLTTASVLALLIAAVVALFFHQDPRTYSTANGGGSTSDVITAIESLISLTLATAAIAAGWLLAAPEQASGIGKRASAI
jgi:hypothetical protein